MLQIPLPRIPLPSQKTPLLENHLIGLGTMRLDEQSDFYKVQWQMLDKGGDAGEASLHISSDWFLYLEGLFPQKLMLFSVDNKSM